MSSKPEVMAEYITYVNPILSEAETQLALARSTLTNPSTERNRILSTITKAIDALKAGRP